MIENELKGLLKSLKKKNIETGIDFEKWVIPQLLYCDKKEHSEPEENIRRTA